MIARECADRQRDFGTRPEPERVALPRERGGQSGRFERRGLELFGHRLHLGHRLACAGPYGVERLACAAGIVVEACLSGDEEAACRAADAVGSLATYPATKLALARWVRRAAPTGDWAGQGIRLNALAPGMIDTPLVAEGRADPEIAPLLDALPIPVGRPGRPEEIAAFAAFLLGPEARFFCGSVLFVDGGSDALFRADDMPVPWHPA